MTRPDITTAPPATALQARIRELGYDQTEVAARIGVTRQAMSNWCTGKRVPRGPRRRQLAEVLDCSVSIIFPDGTVADGPHPEAAAA